MEDVPDDTGSGRVLQERFPCEQMNELQGEIEWLETDFYELGEYLRERGVTVKESAELVPIRKLEGGPYAEGSHIKMNSILSEMLGSAVAAGEPLGRKTFSDGEDLWLKPCRNCGLITGTKKELALASPGRYRCACGSYHNFFRPVFLDGMASQQRAREIEGLHEEYCALLIELGFWGNESCQSPLFVPMCRMPPASGCVVPTGGPLRELMVLCDIFNPLNTSPPTWGEDTERIHICKHCSRGFCSEKNLAEHSHAHSRVENFQLEYRRQREARAVAAGIPRSPAVASSPGVSNAASVEAARKEVDKLTEEIAILKVKKAEFLPILMIDDAALEDCLCRMMKSPRAVQFLEELGVETPADLKELDEALLRQLALLLKVVPKNRLLLRLFGLHT